MSQYFENDNKVISKEKTIEFDILGKHYALKTDNGVFSKSKIDEGTRIFLKTLVPLDLGERILDLGCGYGALGLVLASTHLYASLVLADVNARAVALCAYNARTLGLTSHVTCLQSDVYSNIEGTFDSIVINPPIRAGKKVTYAMYLGAKEYLISGGSLYIVIRKAQGAESASKYIESIFGNISLISRAKGYLILKATKANEK
ncbi:MAG: methyltransferase [Erysipelotrichaceae bacterium]|jgi:16S rRNA (guanine1207-N2)-methyltransferase|nr:methyltransferase [Erysipelotrichaceae bacterium]